jgi:hypothetical protein
MLRTLFEIISMIINNNGLKALFFSFLFFYLLSLSVWFILLAPILIIKLTFLKE